MTRDGTADDRFVAFADVVRRRLLDILRTSPGADEMDFDALVDRLAADAAAGLGSRAQTRLNLIHVHLPKLEQAGLVERDGDTVRLTVSADVVVDALELADEFESA